MEAALRCFIRSGYNGTSMDDIVRESHLSKGTLYWHFTNKRELFIALFDSILADMLAPLDNLFMLDLPPSQKLERIASSMESLVEKGDMLTTIPLHFLIEIWQDNEFLQHYLKMLREYSEGVSGLIAEGIALGEFRQDVDPEEAAWGLMAMIDGIFLYRLAGLPLQVSHQAALMIDLVLHGLLRQKQK
jgi:AcrR family transcriptional regulator